MRNKALLFILVVSIFSLYSCQQKTDTGTPQGGDTTVTGDTTAGMNRMGGNDFVMNAASAGMMEVELGRYASTRARSRQVKEFGQMMVTDHTRANNELKTLAQTKNITLPDSMMQEHKDMMTKLREASREDFDKNYMDEMVSDHEKDIDLFKEASQNHSDPEIKAWAAKTLPVLQRHLERAKNIQGTLK